MGFLSPDNLSPSSRPLKPARAPTCAPKKIRPPDVNADGDLVPLRLKRLEVHAIGGLMGAALRSPITGQIRLRGGVGVHSDFSVVDLWTRDEVGGNPKSLSMDLYLFRPYPLLYRTWVYHWLFNSGHVFGETSNSGAEADGMVRHVMSHPCIDIPDNCGRWSPAMSYALICMWASITGDWVFLAVSCLAFVMLAVLSTMMNNPFVYRYCRVASLPIRVGYLIFICLRARMNNPLSAVGFVFCLLGFICDLFFGDLATFLYYKYTCTYEIIRKLPNRVFVCRRHGAAELRRDLTEPLVDESISGVGMWELDMVLITDISGLLVELRPMTEAHWQSLTTEFQATGKTMRYIGIDAYGSDRRSAYDFFGNGPMTPSFPPSPKMSLRDIARTVNSHREPDTASDAGAAS